MFNQQCLYCFTTIEQSFGWQDILLNKPTEKLCHHCSAQLNRISGATCSLCGRQLDLLAEQFKQNDTCLDCIKWRKLGKYLDHNTSLYQYNDFLKSIMAKFKYRGDYQLIEIFSNEIKIAKHTYDLFVPIPLSIERQIERGFNQAEAIGRIASLSMTNALIRIHSEKQAKKSRQQRLASHQVFQLNQIVTGKRILLIDDIYTTGTTLQHAAQILKEGGAETIHSFTIAHG